MLTMQLVVQYILEQLIKTEVWKVHLYGVIDLTQVPYPTPPSNGFSKKVITLPLPKTSVTELKVKAVTKV